MEVLPVVATDVVFQQALMGLAGCIIAGLFWLGILINL